ncbi:TetR family transcriptional regulator [Niveibacterium sp. SC-1]|uniref:TetR/AcrR family transcriptional regulator n=1 Tax=Niveibacterium sp. SC-1 TaxID=3135646 RepID=UPI00311FEB48
MSQTEVRGAETPERILDVAEVLFTEHGFDGTSMRMITGQANVNLAAVNYHFGTKEALFQAVFRRRIDQLNQARIVALDRMEREASGAPLKPSQVLEGFFGPALAMAADTEHGGHTFMRLLGRTYTEPTQFVRRFMAEEYADVMNRYADALYGALPGVPVSEILWRLHFMMGAVSYAISGIDALKLVVPQLDDDPSKIGSRLMAFLLGGLRAPLADAPRSQAAGAQVNHAGSSAMADASDASNA